MALRRLVRNTGRVFDAISEDGHSLRALIEGGEATFSALASRDDALAETFEVLPTFLRETRTTVGRLEQFARDTDPLVRDLRGPADDLGPTLEDLAELSPDLERLFRAVGPLVTASRNGVPAAERLLEGIQPVLESAHVFLPELNPTLSYLSFAREQVATFLAPGGSALGGNGIGGYRSSRFAEHYLPQSAIIDSRSLERRTARPFWERANSYVAPNAWERSIGLGAIEAFDCGPAGGEVRNPSGSGATSAPPCFVAPPLLFQDQRYPKLRRGRGRLVEPAEGSCRELAGPALGRATRPRAAPARRAGPRWRRGRSAPPPGPGCARRPGARPRSRPGGARARRARAIAARSTPCGVAMWRS